MRSHSAIPWCARASPTRWPSATATTACPPSSASQRRRRPKPRSSAATNVAQARWPMREFFLRQIGPSPARKPAFSASSPRRRLQPASGRRTMAAGLLLEASPLRSRNAAHGGRPPLQARPRHQMVANSRTPGVMGPKTCFAEANPGRPCGRAGALPVPGTGDPYTTPAGADRLALAEALELLLQCLSKVTAQGSSIPTPSRAGNALCRFSWERLALDSDRGVLSHRLAMQSTCRAGIDRRPCHGTAEFLVAAISASRGRWFDPTCPCRGRSKRAGRSAAADPSDLPASG